MIRGITNYITYDMEPYIGNRIKIDVEERNLVSLGIVQGRINFSTALGGYNTSITKELARQLMNLIENDSIPFDSWTPLTNDKNITFQVYMMKDNKIRFRLGCIRFTISDSKQLVDILAYLLPRDILGDEEEKA